MLGCGPGCSSSDVSGYDPMVKLYSLWWWVPQLITRHPLDFPASPHAPSHQCIPRLRKEEGFVRDETAGPLSQTTNPTDPTRLIRCTCDSGSSRPNIPSSGSMSAESPPSTRVETRLYGQTATQVINKIHSSIDTMRMHFMPSKIVTRHLSSQKAMIGMLPGLNKK